MMQHDDPARCCRALTEAACAAGGPDNVTVAVVRFLEGEPPGMPVDPAAPVAFERRPAVA
jgi:protein phosphatase